MKLSSSATKMNSRRGSRSARRVVIASAIVLVGFLILIFFRGGVGSATAFLFTPIVSLKTWFLESSGSIPTYFRTQASLHARIGELEEELARREGDAELITRLRLEQSSYLQLPDGIPAGVIARPSQTPYDTLLIDKGSVDGILKDSLVYTGDDMVIGSIVAVYTHSALVQLASAPNRHSTAFIFGPNIFTDAEGMGGGILRITVPHGVPLREGDIVMLPGTGAGTYGTVEHIESPESSPQQYGYVVGHTPLSSIRFVSVAYEPPPQITYEDALRAVSSASSTLFTVPLPDTVSVGTTTEQ